MKEGTADSQLPNKINSHSNLSPPYESLKEPKEQAKEPRTNFSADPDFQKMHPDPGFQLAGVEGADSFYCSG